MVILGQEGLILAIYLVAKKNSVDLSILLVVGGSDGVPMGFRFLGFPT